MKRLSFRPNLLTSFILIILFCSGCAHYQVNQPLETATQKESYDFDHFNQPPDADEIFIVLTFSGGGTRAAALAYGVLEKMQAIKLPNSPKSLLDEIDVISTVSGGSFTGAYYALFGENIFTDFKKKFLYRSIEKELTLKLFNPITWFRLASPYFSRIDLAAELYDQTIFESKTFETLAQKAKRPFVIVNATNVYQGGRFEFTSDQFRYLGSDVLSYPMARAVAASSAFPFLLVPISLVNYIYPSDFQIPQEDQLALEDYWNNKRRYYSSLNNVMYENKEEHPFLHLMDGGLADNLGLRAIYDLYVRGNIRQKINNNKIKRFLVIVVNAKPKAPQDFDKRETPPGLAEVGLKTCTLSMENYSFETVEIFKELISERIKTQKHINDCQKLLDTHCEDGFTITPLAGSQLKLYIADLTFDNLPQKSERDYFNNLPTSFTLNKSVVDKLIEVGGRLLEEHPQFKKFMEEY